jgi:hypothetical protein
MPWSKKSLFPGTDFLTRRNGGKPCEFRETLSPTEEASQAEMVEARSEASRVFLRSMATVIGPTPPGTGVIADAA